MTINYIETQAQMTDLNWDGNTVDAEEVPEPSAVPSDALQDWSKQYSLIPASDPILSRPVDKFDFKNPPVDPMALALDLLGHLRHYKGLGLSANQLGLPYRVFAMEGDPAFVCFNPVITATGDNVELMDEGCLTYPALFMKVKRPAAIRVRFQDPNGDFVTKKFSGMTARIFQHEYDHMEGIMYVQRVTRLVLDRARKQQDKLIKKMRQGK
tara:strand:+ start:7587 stop:8219 length:633 start_codon:yes stop_codon:yes gene_type:complete